LHDLLQLEFSISLHQINISCVFIDLLIYNIVLANFLFNSWRPLNITQKHTTVWTLNMIQMAVSTDFTCYTFPQSVFTMDYKWWHVMKFLVDFKESHFETKWPLGWHDWQCASDWPVSSKRHSPAFSL